jgi:hypothetical protein
MMIELDLIEDKIKQICKLNGVKLEFSGASNLSDSRYYMARVEKDFDPEYGFLSDVSAHIRLSNHFNDTTTADSMSADKKFNLWDDLDIPDFLREFQQWIYENKFS